MARIAPGTRNEAAPARRAADIVIQAIHHRSDVGMTRESHIDRDAVDPQTLTAMATLQNLMDNQ